MGKPFKTYFSPPLTAEEIEKNKARSISRQPKKKASKQTEEQVLANTMIRMAKESPLKAKQRAERAELHALMLAEHELAREAKRLAKMLLEADT